MAGAARQLRHDAGTVLAAGRLGPVDRSTSCSTVTSPPGGAMRPRDRRSRPPRSASSRRWQGLAGAGDDQDGRRRRDPGAHNRRASRTTLRQHRSRHRSLRHARRLRRGPATRGHPTPAARGAAQLATGGLSAIDRVIALAARAALRASVGRRDATSRDGRRAPDAADATGPSCSRNPRRLRSGSCWPAMGLGLDAARHALKASAGDIIGSVDTMAGRSLQSLRLGTQGRRRAENRSRRALSTCSASARSSCVRCLPGCSSASGPWPWPPPASRVDLDFSRSRGENEDLTQRGGYFAAA